VTLSAPQRKFPMQARALFASILKPYSGGGAQNRRQKVFNKGLWVCARGLDTLKIDKNSTDL